MFHHLLSTSYSLLSNARERVRNVGRNSQGEREGAVTTR